MMEKRVLITGGTKGIGRAVAECLAKAGYSLILTYASDKEEALRVADGLLQQYKVEVLTLQADISDRKSIPFFPSSPLFFFTEAFNRFRFGLPLRLQIRFI